MTIQQKKFLFTPKIRMLSDQEVRAIHYASIEFLRETGIDMKDLQGRSLLLDSATWDSNGGIKIPEILIIDYLSKSSSRIPMHDQLGRLTMPLEPGKVFFGTDLDVLGRIDHQPKVLQTSCLGKCWGN